MAKKNIFQKIRDFFIEEVEEDIIQEDISYFQQDTYYPDNDDIGINENNYNYDSNDSNTSNNFEDTIINSDLKVTAQDLDQNLDIGMEKNHVSEDYLADDKKYYKLFIAAVLVFVVFVSSFSGYLFANQVLGKAAAHGDNGTGTSVEGSNPAGMVEEKDNIEKILLIGIDQRPGEVSRADTIILALVNTDSPEVKLLSIPRDTRTIIPGRGNDKVNHAQAFGGPTLVAETVSNMLGIEVDKYVQLNFNGFREIIDILDGVEYTVEKRMYYPPEDINLQPGKQVLDGNKALQYVRFRSDGKGDIGRVERQQKFMLELIEQKLKLKNVLKIPELVGEVRKSVKTNMGLMEMVSIAKAMKELESEKVTTKMLPGEAKYIGGVSYWIPESTNLEELFADLEESDSEI